MVLKPNQFIENNILPVDIVFHPSWWHKHTGISFDEDFFYHPLKRVEAEAKMEKELYERFGNFGLGEKKPEILPVIGAVHNAAGYIISEMLGCKIKYDDNAAPTVIPANKTELSLNVEDAFKSNAFKKLENLREKLKTKFGYLYGDINWGGILNIALDLQGEKVLMDFFMEPGKLKNYINDISVVLETFVNGIEKETGTSSISVNRNVRHIKKPVFLHSECSHTMISTEQYDEFLLPIDIEWSKKHRPFGIHYCGTDPHRYAESFAKIPHLDFLDVGWGGDLKILRKHLPNTFLNIRLDPVNINSYSNEELANTITKLVKDSANPYLTGICCINMDDKVEDEKINVLFETVKELKKEYEGNL